jgi:hypothetical protein
MESGKYIVNYCRLEQGLAIRLVLLNPDLTEEFLTGFFQTIIQTGQEMLENTFQTKGV